MKKINIQMKNISKSYGNQKVLDELSLNITNDSYFAICGKSGAGKSTFMNILGLIENFDEGEYIFNDVNIKRNADYYKIRRQNIGFIYQSYNLIPKMSCRENILMPLIYTKVRYNDVENEFRKNVERLQIEDLLDKDVSLLSGGEKQRVAIARSLILNPGLLIADEPTGNLDEQNRNIVLDILKDEHKNGRAIVVITHDETVAQNAKIKYILQNGKLI